MKHKITMDWHNWESLLKGGGIELGLQILVREMAYAASETVWEKA